MAKQHQTNETDLSAVIANSHPKRRWMGIVFPLIAVAIVAGGSFFIFGKPNAKADEASQFRTQALKKGDVGLTITATGNLEPTNEVTVGSEISGLVLEVYVDSNDRVVKGQELALIDTTNLENELRSSRASLDSAKASVKQAEATLKQSKATLARYEQLREKSGGKVPSQSAMDGAIADVDIAEATLVAKQAAVSQSEAQIEIKESDLSKALIKSPTNGIVLTRSVEPGQTVAASFSAPELFVIAEDLTTMKLEVAIAEADIGQLADGQKASFTVDAWPERKYGATVKKVSFGSEITDNVVTYATELDVKNEDMSLRPGMTATADIYVAQHEDVWLVPVQALRFKPTAPGGANTAGANNEKTFLEKMIPRPPRRNNNGAGMVAGAPSRAQSEIWVMSDGMPKPIQVHVGLSDGKVSEVSSDQLKAGLEVVLYQIAAGS